MNPPPERARKVGGSYQADGWVLCEFTTLVGERRVVFEFEEIPGMLHIFHPNQVAFLERETAVSK